ncbi:unnamed protein product [Rotaria sordida]|uniref:Uncharacterized protein n=1 Tax=Rotaria sordida TaxID=392033 RepID=A0A814DFH0_9BILA|nr:unnamed protein product [Rotaria sordida]CAF3710313.1 unnamed protein product [Rotaria sordida]
MQCKQFQEKIMHIEYCLYLQRFLIAIAHGNFSGIIQTFAFHPISSNLIYLLVNTFSQYTLIQIDLNNSMTKLNIQLKAINDFTIGTDILLVTITYESNDIPSDQFYEFTTSSSSNQQEQSIIISQKSKTLSRYDINPINDYNKIHLIDEMILDTELEYLGFANNDLSILLIRNLFHIAIYKQ